MKKAAQVLIARGVNFDSCGEFNPGTILFLRDTDYNLPHHPWAYSMRLDNQGNINYNGRR